jgi:hypothetical protein
LKEKNIIGLEIELNLGLKDDLKGINKREAKNQRLIKY